MVQTWVERRALVGALVRREVLVRYRGSLLGFMWSIVTPLVLLGVYTVVFGHVFRVRWAGMEERGMLAVTVMLFCGLVPFNFLNETLSRACLAVTGSPNYVKRVAFPTEILPLVSLLGALVHAAIGCVVLAGGVLLAQGSLPWSWLLLPVVWLPLIVASAAASLFLAGANVFIRDLSHIVGILLLIIMFASPVFYPDTMVPERLQFLMFVNPLANLVSNMRKICVLGVPINWWSWGCLMGLSLVSFILAAGWYVRIRRRFADVL